MNIPLARNLWVCIGYYIILTAQKKAIKGCQLVYMLPHESFLRRMSIPDESIRNLTSDQIQSSEYVNFLAASKKARFDKKEQPSVETKPAEIFKVTTNDMELEQDELTSSTMNENNLPVPDSTSLQDSEANIELNPIDQSEFDNSSTKKPPINWAIILAYTVVGAAASLVVFKLWF